MNTTSAIQIKHATVLLTAQQIIEAVRQLDAQEREQVLQALREPAPAKEESYRYSVAALNSLGWKVFAQPKFGEIQIDMFYSGPEGDARASVEQLIQDVGLRAIWLGGLDMLNTVDALGTLWVTLAFRRGWGHGAALKLLTR